MTARASVEADFAFDGVAIYLGRFWSPDSREIMEPTNPVWTRSSGPAIAGSGPSLRLPEDVARALYDALAVYFHGVSDTQTLRSDYLAERKRVDRMIEYLTSPASINLQQPNREAPF